MPGYIPPSSAAMNYNAQQGLNSQNFANTNYQNQQQFGYQQALQTQDIANQQALNAANNYTSAYNTNTQANASMANANTAAQAGNYQANVAADASKYPATLKYQQFEQLFPYLTKGLNSSYSNSSYANAGGSQPTINASPVYNEQQIQQQVNNQRAANDRTTATQMRQTQNQLGGRGFSANSPLLAQLNQNAQLSNLATNTQNEQQTRFNAAQANAQQVLGAQQAQETQYANRQQEAINRQQTYNQYNSALLAALAGMV